MHYPWWYVPHITSPMLIAFIAVVHVIVSHYAVGGGLFLAIETQHAHRTQNREYLDYLRRHAKFFVLVTVVFGAVSGVGIWWTIGLASPLATEVLIRTFVFGWAIEWVFFFVEIASAFLFYYLWGRLRPRTHILLGYVYAVSAFMSLVIINGILSFMLHPGEWPASQNFWHGFFNPQYWPQLIARTGGCLLLASLYVYFHMALFCRSEGLRALVAKRSARPAMVGAVLVAIGSLLFLIALPESARLNLEKAAALNIFMALLFAITVIVFAMFFFGPTRNPQWLSPGFGILFLLFGFAAVSIGEFVREAVRKPYVVYNVVMSNGILAQEIPQVARRGYLESGPFTRAEVAARHPQAAAGGEIDEAALTDLPESERIHLGRMLFMTHCNQCHAAEQGMSSVAALTAGWDRNMLMSVVEFPNRHQAAMPPWAGTRDEARLLADYMESIQRAAPGGMYFGEEAR